MPENNITPPLTSGNPPPNNPPSNKSASVSEETMMSVVAYIIFFVPLLPDAKNNPVVKFHVKQGLTLLIAAVAASALSQILYNVLPYGFWNLWNLINYILEIGILVLLVVGILNAVNHRQNPLPVIGKYAEKFKF